MLINNEYILLIKRGRMARETVLGGAIEFMDKLGVYDVLLPFLLTFTLMYAILERTKVLGTEVINDKPYPRKNLNAMVAFSTAFFVIASSQLVEIITEFSAKIVIVIVASVFLLMTVAVFYKEEDKAGFDKDKDKNWRAFFTTTMIVAVSLIAADSVPVGNGKYSALEYGWGFIASSWSSSAVASIIFVLILVGFIYFMTSDPKNEGNE
jgi:hypothetical protein